MTAPTLAPATAWRTRAACRDSDPDAFHRREGDRTHTWYATARTICATCPVRRDCIEAALAGPKPVDGSVWGWWVFGTHGKPDPHPADLDLLAAHYPKEIHR